ncbi:MAG: hypothetical protein JSW68_03920 [Burkholderiales bacterium]|nr:MAG: hypothetical protein JSW68_03920 [Burkholderiales bacterium]
MKKHLNRHLASVAVAAILTSAATTAQSAPYWGCGSGYTFQTQSNAARCYKPAQTRYRSLEPCPQLTVLGITVGYGLVRDVTGNTDLCVTQLRPLPAGTNATLPTACRSGWSKQVRSGGDRCRRVYPEDIRAPSVKREL